MMRNNIVNGSPARRWVLPSLAVAPWRIIIAVVVVVTTVVLVGGGPGKSTVRGPNLAGTGFFTSCAFATLLEWTGGATSSVRGTVSQQELPKILIVDNIDDGAHGCCWGTGGGSEDDFRDSQGYARFAANDEDSEGQGSMFDLWTPGEGSLAYEYAIRTYRNQTIGPFHLNHVQYDWTEGNVFWIRTSSNKDSSITTVTDVVQLKANLSSLHADADDFMNDVLSVIQENEEVLAFLQACEP